MAAQKEPRKADWKALRRAFSETSHYQPYNSTWRQEINTVAKNLQDGKLKEAEAALKKLLERERFMRIDAHALALALYDQTGDSEKARFIKTSSRAFPPLFSHPAMEPASKNRSRFSLSMKSTQCWARWAAK